MTATTTARQLDSENPWPGLESFGESAHDFFFGRDREAASLLNHVHDASVTVLYGRSGLGKTSLLQAGLFPLLREENFLPVYVRLELQQGSTALSRQLHQSIYGSIQANAPDALLPAADESLWEYLHRSDFELWSAQNYPLTPVIVIDQFEELFTLGERVPDLVREFMNDLGDLAENRIPADVAARIDSDEAEADRFQLRTHNYKLLITLREDFLPHLEEWSQLIPALKRSRVRLLPLHADKAFDAVYKPAAHLMSAGLAERVVRIVAGEDLGRSRDSASTNSDRSDGRGASGVEPALLSLFCRELNEERKRRGQSEFDEHLVEDAKRDILANYYLSCVRDLPPRVAEFIESELITEKGFRDSYAREDAVPSRLTEDELSRLIGSRLLRLEEYHGAQRIELTHDVLTGVVREHRDRRRAEAEKAALAARAEEEKQALEQAAERHAAELDRERQSGRRLRKLSAAMALVCIAAVVMAMVAYMKGNEATQARNDADARSKEALAERLTSQAQAILAGGQPGSELEALDKLLAAQHISMDPDLGDLLTTLRDEARLTRIVDLPMRSVLSADGERIATSKSRGVQVVDTRTGMPTGEPFAADGSVAASSQDGRYLAISNQNNTIRVWDAATGQAIGPPIAGSNTPFLSVVVSPDGNRVAASFGEDARLWDTQTGRQIGPPLGEPDAPVLALAFSPDGNRLASAGIKNTVKFWDARSGAANRETSPVGDPRIGGDNWILSLAFSPDGHFIAAGGRTVGLGTLLSGGMPLRIWNTDTGEAVGNAGTGNYGMIDSVAFSPDGTRIVTGGSDKTVRLWDGQTGQQVGNPLTLQSVVRHVAFASDGNQIVAVSQDSAQVFHADPDTALTTQVGGSKAAELSEMEQGYGINNDTDQPRIVVLHDDALRRLDADTGEEAGQVIVSEALRGGTQIDFSQDERWLAVVGRDNDIRVLDTVSGRQHGAPMKGHQDSLSAVTFSPDGKLLATGGDDKTIRLWDWERGQQVGEPLTGHKYGVDEIQFSENGRRMYSLSSDSIRAWDTTSWQPVGKPMEASVEGMTISHDGQRIAGAGNKMIWQWDAESGEAVGEPLAGHDKSVNYVQYSPDDRYLVSVSSDRTLRFWDTETGHQIGEPIVTVPAGSTAFVDFSHDGRRVFVIAQRLSLDGNAPFVGGGIWQLPAPGVWRDALCNKLTSNPSDDQWKAWVSEDIPNTELCPGKPKA